jgi:hypothetical protein
LGRGYLDFVVVAAVAAAVDPGLAAVGPVLAVDVPVLAAVGSPVLAAVGSPVLAAVGTYQGAASGLFDLDWVLLVPTGSEVEAGPASVLAAGPAWVLAADHEGRTGRYEAVEGCTQVDTDRRGAVAAVVAADSLVAVGILVAVVGFPGGIAVAVVDSQEAHHFREPAAYCNAQKVRTMMVARQP